MRTRSRVLAGLSVGAILVAACETDDDLTAPDEPTEQLGDEPADQGPATDETEQDEPAEDPEATEDEAIDEDTPSLGVASSELGDHLVDAEGMTVYLHALDGPDEPTCTGDCAAVWAPVPASQAEPTVGDGVEADLVGSVEREDAEAIGVDQQLTYAGHPLYSYIGDTEPGEVGGQELGQIWFVVAPDGEPIGDVPDDAELEELDMDEDAG